MSSAASAHRQTSIGNPLGRWRRDILGLESRLYSSGLFDWVEVNPRGKLRRKEEDVIVKVRESSGTS
jgi:hypothetical protein